MRFYTYPKCSTCRKAKNWLDANEISYDEIHIVENPPSTDELKELLRISELPIKKFFNTSGLRYRELGLKDNLDDLTEQDAIQLLSSDGMLIKRPIITDGKSVSIGVNFETYEKMWLK